MAHWRFLSRIRWIKRNKWKKRKLCKKRKRRNQKSESLWMAQCCEWWECVCVCWNKYMLNSMSGVKQRQRETSRNENWINKSLLFETSPCPIDWIYRHESIEMLATIQIELMHQDDAFHFAVDIVSDWDSYWHRNAANLDVLTSQYYAFQMVVDRHSMTIHRPLPNLLYGWFGR